MAPEQAADQAVQDAFGILGPLEVLRSGRAVPLGGPRQRAVLAVLLLQANRAVSADRLVEDVWEGHAPEASVTSLQTYVFHLRRALEPGRPRGGAPEVLATRDHGYLLRVSRERLDAAVFEDGLAAGLAALEAGRHSQARERLGRALDLWRGPVLADLSGYAFIQAEAARLGELRLAAVEGRIEADLALGRHDAVTAELEQLVADHPLRERLHGQLMLALYRCGRQADALAAYRRVRGLLAAELGIDPGEPLQRLHASILAHDQALDWDGGRQALVEADPVEAHPVEADPVGTPVPSPARGSPRRPAAGSRALARARWPGRRLLAVGSALAVAAAACILAVARPWAGEPAGLPGNSVGLIDSAGGLVGAAVTVGSPDGLAYGDGSVWAVDGTDRAVSRIDPATMPWCRRSRSAPTQPRSPSPAATYGWPTAATGR
jgi:DNA-binding SARP family transcriptional activator